MTLIKVKDENGEEAFLGTKADFDSMEIKEVYVQIEFLGGAKADNFFTSIKDAKEFLETYE